MSEQTIHVYVNIPGQSPCFSTIAEALRSVEGGESGAGEYDVLKELPTPDKHFPEEVSDIPPVVIHIGEGIYREKLVVTRPNMTFLGAGQGKTVLVFGQSAFEQMPDGTKRGTFRTASLRIDTHDFTARHLTIQNDAGFGHTVGQAIALYVDGDRNYFEDCALIASQDTLFTAPLPLKEAQPGGFIGPGRTRPRILGRHCFRNCFLMGDVDFLFGGGIVFYENCEIYSKKPGDRKPPESPDDQVIYGYVTAACTPEGQPFGYVFKDCRLTGDCPPATIYLGRPWREFAKTVFLHCELGAHIHPLGWNDWNKPHGHFYYGEYASYGPGASPETRADFSHQLTAEEAAEYTMEKVLQGWNPEA
ncbi:MAG: pectin methylesterase [Lachnospiraceae bacterium]|nr:pectin methylesterase [Lachnospiraceae bacterium]